MCYHFFQATIYRSNLFSNCVVLCFLALERILCCLLHNLISSIWALVIVKIRNRIFLFCCRNNFWYYIGDVGIFVLRVICCVITWLLAKRPFILNCYYRFSKNFTSCIHSWISRTLSPLQNFVLRLPFQINRRILFC